LVLRFPLVVPAALQKASRLVIEINIHAWPEKRGEAVVESLLRMPLAQDSGRNRKPDVVGRLVLEDWLQRVGQAESPVRSGRAKVI
jgi:hypothetical protein